MLFIQVAPDKISPETFPGMREWIDDINSIRTNPVKVVMGVQDDVPLGIMVFEPGNVLSLYVLPDERRCGVGSELIKYAQGYSKDGKLSAQTHATNVAGICFLHTQGFTVGSWMTTEAGIRYLRMTNDVTVGHRPPEEKYLEHFVKNVPIFLSTAEGNF